MGRSEEVELIVASLPCRQVGEEISASLCREKCSEFYDIPEGKESASFIDYLRCLVRGKTHKSILLTFGRSMMNSGGGGSTPTSTTSVI